MSRRTPRRRATRRWLTFAALIGLVSQSIGLAPVNADVLQGAGPLRLRQGRPLAENRPLLGHRELAEVRDAASGDEQVDEQGQKQDEGGVEQGRGDAREDGGPLGRPGVLEERADAGEGTGFHDHLVPGPERSEHRGQFSVPDDPRGPTGHL